MLYIHSCAKCLKDKFNDKEICFLSKEEIHSGQWWFTFRVGYSQTLLVQTPDDMYWKSTCKHGYNMTMEIVWLKFTGLYSRYYGLTLYTILLMCMYIINSGLILLDLIGPDSRWHGFKKLPYSLVVFISTCMYMITSGKGQMYFYQSELKMVWTWMLLKCIYIIFFGVGMDSLVIYVCTWWLLK